MKKSKARRLARRDLIEKIERKRGVIDFVVDPDIREMQQKLDERYRDRTRYMVELKKLKKILEAM